MFRHTERLRGMTTSAKAADVAALASANAALARRIVRDCFDPVRPDAMARLCSDERGVFLFAAFGSAFPDARFIVDWVTADDKRVAIGGGIEATHAGPWRGVAATGRRISVAVVVSLRVLDGRIVETSVVTDSLAVAEQVGAVEPFAPKACQVYDGATLSWTRR